MYFILSLSDFKCKTVEYNGGKICKTKNQMAEQIEFVECANRWVQ